MKSSRRILPTLVTAFLVLLCLTQGESLLIARGHEEVEADTAEPAAPPEASTEEIQWIRQFGTVYQDETRAVSAYALAVYVAGTNWDFSWPPKTNDIFLRKYDVAGNLVWVRQFGTEAIDSASAVSAGPSGVYVAGTTDGALPGQINSGNADAFLCKYDADGNLLWTRQFGTGEGEGTRANGVFADTSGVYVVGYTDGALPGQTSAGGTDAFVRKYDPNGILLWTHQFGTTSTDIVTSVSTNDSGVYVAGSTGGVLDGLGYGIQDAFLCRYDPDGYQLWMRQFGTAGIDMVAGISADASGVYVAGSTELYLPYSLAFLRKYDANGNNVWIREFEVQTSIAVSGVSANASGVFLAGFTDGVLPGQTNAGESDAFVQKYDAQGNFFWSHQFGTPPTDQLSGISADASGVYVAGRTFGVLPGQTNTGDSDAFVLKIGAPLGDTPAGTDVVVYPDDAGGNTAPVGMVFDNVLESGDTTLTITSGGAPVPGEFKLGNPPVYYDITTTAVFSGMVTVCINYTGTAFANESALRLLHYGAAGWEDITISLDTANNVICGQTSSLSPFTVVEPAAYQFHGFLQPVDNLPVMNVAKAGRTIPVKWQLYESGGGYVSDLGTFLSLLSAPVACDAAPTVIVEEQLASPGATVFRFDDYTNQFIYNWQTSSGWKGCRVLQLTLSDGSQHFAKFNFK